MAETQRRRRRVRHNSETTSETVNPETGSEPTVEDVPAGSASGAAPTIEPARGPAPGLASQHRSARGFSEPPPIRGDDDRDSERGLRGLVGSGNSQVSLDAALRARDATRPSEQDLAEAQAQLAIVRRGWTPPPAPTS